MSGVRRLVTYLWQISRRVPYARPAIALIIFLGVVAGFSNTALIALINTTVSSEEGSAWAIRGFLGFCVLLPVSRFLSSVTLLFFTQKATLTTHLRLCRGILDAPLSHLEKLGAHRLLATLTNDVPAISTALTSIPVFCMQATIVLGGLLYLAFLSLKGVLLVLVFMTLGILTYQWPMIQARRHYQGSRALFDSFFKGLKGLTEGTKELKIHHPRCQEFFRQDLEGPLVGIQKHALRANIYLNAASSWGQVLNFLLIGLVLFVLPTWWHADRQFLTGYAMTLIYMVGPLESLLNMLPQYNRAAVAVDKIEELGLSLTQHGSSQASPGEGASPPRALLPWHRLELVGVSHSYRGEDPDDRFTLGPVDLAFEPGELIFLVGGNGSGKTTLAKVLLGLYTPESGEVRLDGQPIGEHNRESYRQLFSVVFSDFHLFETLLGLTSGDLDASAGHYIRQLHLEKKVQVKDGVFSTIDLSQGQRKRLALLTAYLEDRSIYLFDEWAADQDPYFKEIFYRDLLPELRARGKTVLAISHDDRYYDVADRIIKLDYGQITTS